MRPMIHAVVALGLAGIPCHAAAQRPREEPPRASARSWLQLGAGAGSVGVAVGAGYDRRIAGPIMLAVRARFEEKIRSEYLGGNGIPEHAVAVGVLAGLRVQRSGFIARGGVGVGSVVNEAIGQPKERESVVALEGGIHQRVARRLAFGLVGQGDIGRRRTFAALVVSLAVELP